MCIYPKLIKNPKYKSNKKNGGVIPPIIDERVLYVPIGCGQCYECRAQKRREWTTRLLFELKKDPKCKFVTLTFSNESLAKLIEKYGKEESNFIAGKAIRLFLERWRKTEKKSIKHWLITELGHTGTERIHLHGFLWTDKDNDFLSKKWDYGFIRVGEYCSEKSINYIMKYVSKLDNDHKGFFPQIFCSSGIGNGYQNSYSGNLNIYNGENTIEYFRTSRGTKLPLPIYWRNKLYSEEEREKLWIHKLNKPYRYVAGVKVDVNDEKTINKVLEAAQEKNKRLGYGDWNIEWKKKSYNCTIRAINDNNRKLAFKIINDWFLDRKTEPNINIYVKKWLKRKNCLENDKEMLYLCTEQLKKLSKL